MDSGATSHMTNNASNSFIQTYNGNDMTYVGDDNSILITHTGDAFIDPRSGKLQLKDVLVVLDLKKKL